jgi:hypothetical protein
MKLQNQKSLTTQLSKSFIFNHHLVVLLGGFGDVAAMW